jgi:hypothetical protein
MRELHALVIGQKRLGANVMRVQYYLFNDAVVFMHKVAVKNIVSFALLFSTYLLPGFGGALID